MRVVYDFCGINCSGKAHSFNEDLRPFDRVCMFLSPTIDFVCLLWCLFSANEEVERDESLINISAVDPGVKQALMDIGDRVQRDADECDSEGNPLPNAEDNEEDRQPRLGPGNDPRRHDGQTREVNSPPDQRDSGKTAHLPKPSHSVAAKYARSSDCRSLAELCQSRRRRFKEVLIRVQRIEQNSRRKARENTASQPILLNGVRRVLMQDRMQRTLQVKVRRFTYIWHGVAYRRDS